MTLTPGAGPEAGRGCRTHRPQVEPFGGARAAARHEHRGQPAGSAGAPAPQQQAAVRHGRRRAAQARSGRGGGTGRPRGPGAEATGPPARDPTLVCVFSRLAPPQRADVSRTAPHPRSPGHGPASGASPVRTKGGAEETRSQEGAGPSRARAEALHLLVRPADAAEAPRSVPFPQAEAIFDPSDASLGRSLVTYFIERLFCGALSVAVSSGTRPTAGEAARNLCTRAR